MDRPPGQPLPSGLRSSRRPCRAPTMTQMSAFRAAMTALLMLAAAACGSAAAAPAPRPVAPVAVPESVQLVRRLARESSTVLPDVSGLSVDAARKRMPGLTVNVVLFGRAGGEVSAQWPLAGETKPADGVVVVWVGRPPRPQAAPPPAAAPGTQLVTTDAVPPPLVGDATAVERPAGSAAVAVTPPSAGGVTPGLEGMVPPPHGPRANIRTMAPAEPGTALAGRASWYGPGFEGRGTACGTTFDPSQLTIASRELRCGTVVTVTGPGGSVQATVTDWGPAEWTNRRFDLSQATFEAVASLGSGVIDATVEVR